MANMFGVWLGKIYLSPVVPRCCCWIWLVENCCAVIYREIFRSLLCIVNLWEIEWLVNMEEWGCLKYFLNNLVFG